MKTIKTNMTQDMQAMCMPSPVVSTPMSFRHEVIIDKPLVYPSDWREEISTIRNAGPGDVVEIHLNGPGGNLAVAGAYLKAIAESQAHIVGHIDHECSSALTFIFLACHEWVVADDAEFMVHTASSGYGGKENNLYEYAIFLNKSVEKLLKKYYTGFLTEEEIERVRTGSDMHMDSDEIIDRIHKMMEYRESLNEEPSEQQLAYDALKDISKEEILENLFPDLAGKPSTEDKEVVSYSLGEDTLTVYESGDVHVNLPPNEQLFNFHSVEVDDIKNMFTKVELLSINDMLCLGLKGKDCTKTDIASSLFSSLDLILNEVE